MKPKLRYLVIGYLVNQLTEQRLLSVNSDGFRRLGF